MSFVGDTFIGQRYPHPFLSEYQRVVDQASGTAGGSSILLGTDSGVGDVAYNVYAKIVETDFGTGSYTSNLYVEVTNTDEGTGTSVAVVNLEATDIGNGNSNVTDLFGQIFSLDSGTGDISLAKVNASLQNDDAGTGTTSIIVHAKITDFSSGTGYSGEEVTDKPDIFATLSSTDQASGNSIAVVIQQSDDSATGSIYDVSYIDIINLIKELDGELTPYEDLVGHINIIEKLNGELIPYVDLEGEE